MALDFFGVSLSGQIVQFPDGPDGQLKTIDLWTESATTNREGRPTTFDALSYVSQVNMELVMGDNAKLQVVLTPPFDVGLRFLQSDLVRFGTGRLQVTIGYSTGTPDGATSQQKTLPFFGLMQKPDVSIGTDVTITLNALGIGYSMTTVGGSLGKTYSGKLSPAEVVESVLKKYVDRQYTGLDIKGLYDAVPPKQKETDPFFQPIIQYVREYFKKHKDVPEKLTGISQGPRNDWWFIRELVENYGFDLFIEGNQVFIAKKTDWMNRTTGFGDQRGPRKHFKLKGNVDPYINMFPILSFVSDTTAVWMENGMGCVVAKDFGDDKKGETQARASAKDTEITQVKEKSGLDCDAALYTDEPNEASKNLPVNPKSPEGRAKLAGEWKKSMMTNGVQGEFATIGIPSLRPGDVVEVSGFEYHGQPDSQQVLFNGPYGILNVKHSVGVGGFTTTFRGVMNFFPKAFKEAAAKTKGDKVESEPLADDKSVGKKGKRRKTVKRKKK